MERLHTQKKMQVLKKTSYPIAQRLFAMRRYGGGMLYAALPLHRQRGCFQIRTHDQQLTKAQLYRCTRARPQKKNKKNASVNCNKSFVNNQLHLC